MAFNNPLAHMNSYRPPSSFSRDESISFLKGPREQVRDTKYASSKDFGPASKGRQRGREQQTARESPKIRDRQQPTPSSSGTFTLQNHSQTLENHGSPYHTSQGDRPQSMLHDPHALVKRNMVSAHQAEVRAQQVEEQPFVVSWSLPPGAGTSTRAPDRSLPVQEETEDDAGVGTRGGGPSIEKDNKPLLDPHRAEFPPRADRTPDKTGGARYDPPRRPSHPSIISTPRWLPGDAMSMQSSPSHEPVPRPRAPMPTRGETRKSVKRRMLYISNPEPTSSDDETVGAPTPTRGETRKSVKRRTLYISNPEPTSSDEEIVGAPTLTRGEIMKRTLYISNPEPTSSDEETEGEIYVTHLTYYNTPGQVYDKRRAGAIMPLSEDNDDEADFAREETGYDADINNEKSVFYALPEVALVMLSITDTALLCKGRTLVLPCPLGSQLPRHPLLLSMSLHRVVLSHAPFQRRI
jgi:hypothetical protein